jgi:hypothetical protein
MACAMLRVDLNFFNYKKKNNAQKTQEFPNKQKKKLGLGLLIWLDLISFYNFDNMNKKYNHNKETNKKLAKKVFLKKPTRVNWG